MDYEEEEQYEEMQAELQAEFIEIDAKDARYLDLRDDRERQGYAILKDRSFVHTRAFDLDLLIKIGMYEDFSNIWHEIGWDNFIPVEEYGSRLLTIQFLCTLREVENGVYFRLFERIFAFLENFCRPPRFQQTLADFSRSSLPCGFNRHEFWGPDFRSSCPWQVCTSVRRHS